MSKIAASSAFFSSSFDVYCKEYVAIEAVEHLLFNSLLQKAWANSSAPSLTIGEWCALADANNGVFHPYCLNAKFTLESLWFGVESSAIECNEKWSVDCAVLAQRLRAMPIFEQMIAFDIAHKFWKEKPSAGEPYAKVFTRLRATGLI